MSPVMRALALLVPALWLACAAAAEPDPRVQIEVDFLLGYVAASGCEFYRNGTWHEAAAAQAHLRDKYRMLAGSRSILTAEDFIDKVASYSSFSGERYQVRCKGAAATRADQWLREALGRFRTFNKKPASSRGGSEAGWPALALRSQPGLAGIHVSDGPPGGWPAMVATIRVSRLSGS